jgi:flavin reductase (DIM6/NTAB) family NADH-FMN oxidoreductase RutF
MFYEPRRRDHGLKYDPLKALIAPRPIGWISTISAAGIPNLAPYSFFNILSENPAVVGFSSSGMKDSANNAQETGEFVCNIVTKADAAAMNQSSAIYPPGVNEFEMAGLAMEASRLVRPPRVKGIVAALECKLTDIINMRGHDGQKGSYFLVLGEIIGVYVDERILKDGRIDSATMAQLARLGYAEYAAVEAILSIARPARP